MTQDSRDPGWAPALRAGLLDVFAPWRIVGRTKRLSHLDGLTTTRIIWLVLIESLLLFLITLSFIAHDRPAHPAGGWLLAVALVGCASAFLTFNVIQRTSLKGGEPEALLKSYQMRFFIGFAEAEVAALFGFVVVFVTGRLVSYVIGLAFTLVGMMLVAPTTKNLARDQRALREQGSSLSLVEVLMSGPPPGAKRRRPSS